MKSVLVSIFVNPLQFGPNEDFSAYPRTLNDDVEKLQNLQKNYPDSEIIVFSPESTEIMFPKDHQTTIINKQMDKILCGKSRPGHFEGVCTVVYRLFKLLSPQVAYFGLKDYQQVQVIKRMVKDLMLDVEIKTCETIREVDGLALSSRNSFLNQKQRETALSLFKALKELEEIIKGNEWSKISAKVSSFVEVKLKENENYRWDYLEVHHPDLMTKLSNQHKDFVVLGAIYIGQTRLIDNLIIKGNEHC